MPEWKGRQMFENRVGMYIPTLIQSNYGFLKMLMYVFTYFKKLFIEDFSVPFCFSKNCGCLAHVILILTPHLFLTEYGIEIQRLRVSSIWAGRQILTLCTLELTAWCFCFFRDSTLQVSIVLQNLSKKF